MLDLYVRLQSLLATREKGATAVEYGIMVALIAAVALIGGELNTAFTKVLTALQNAAGGGGTTP